MKKEKTPARLFQNNAYMFALAWRISPRRVVLAFLDNALDRIHWIFSAVIFMRLVVSGLEREAGLGEMAAIVALSTAALVAVAMVRSWLCHKTFPEMELRSNEKLNAMLFDKAANVELACYEDPEFYDRYTLAIKEVGDRLWSVIGVFGSFVILPASIGYVIYQMVLIDPYLLFFAVFPLIGTFVFDKAAAKLRYEQTLENNVNERKKSYVNRIFYLAQYAKEMRLSNVSKILNWQYDEGYEGTMSIIKKYAGRIFPPSFFNGVFSHTIVFYGIFLYGAYRVIVSQTIAIGEFVILFGAMRYVSFHLEGMSSNLVDFYKNALYINNLRGFLDYEPAIPEDQPGEEIKRFGSALELCDVGFAYKGSENKTLSHINMKIKRGEKIAIVGCNGAGKSTLIKLLLRLYDPTEGEILLDGTNIKAYNLQSYRRLFSAAFQDQRMFSMSVADNVSDDREKAIQALKQSGIWDRVQEMPHKEDSTLTREFDPEGVVLSGGETQKISIARAFAKDFDIGIFDEPSSALDPIAEYNLFESMMEAFAGKTMIFISHRLSSASLADRIYLFDSGAVLEEGTHDELMQKNGAYAKMFIMQAEKYIENEYAVLEGGEL
ncbi:MAG: ABC transporter ATP-binding protein/permease [Oscillospiraceae bacterium]|nr:ABC transporter ATP-binding protein/permease [Oscillospiraceae bacterium]